MTRLTRALLVAGTALAAPLAAHATILPSVCSVNDLNLTIGAATYHPSSCIADIESGQAPADPVTETGLFNGAFSTTLQFLAKADPSSGNSVGAPMGGIAFTLNASGGTTGTFIVTWQDINGPGTLPNLPVTVDFGVLVNGGSNGSGYIFSDVVLPVSPTFGTGNFSISFNNPGGQTPGLSHMILLGSTDDPPNEVPEPAGLALLGLGLLGTAAVRRRS